MSPDDISAKCRTCSNPSNNIIYHTIYGSVENYKILEMLNAIVPQVDYNTTPVLLSIIICKYCVEKLLIGYKFQQLCIETNKKFQDELEFNMLDVTQPKLEDTTDPLTEEDSYNRIAELPVEEIKCEVSYDDTEGGQLPLEELKNEVSYEIIEHVENDNADEIQDFNGDYILSENDVRQQTNSTFTFKCPQCPEVFDKMYSLTAHFKVHKKPTKKKDKAKDKQIEVDAENDEDDADNDKETESKDLQKNKDTSNFPCGLCGKLFERFYSFNRHMTTVHSESRPHECEICKYRFATPNLLLTHLRQHEDNNDKSHNTKSQSEDDNSKEKMDYTESDEDEDDVDPFDPKKKKRNHDFPCKICGRKFYAQYALVRHNNSVHSESRPHECDICKYRFDTVKLLESHKKLQHEKNVNGVTKLPAEKFKCPHCTECFPKLKLLIEHRKIHTRKPKQIPPKSSNESPHLCTLCGKSYSSLHNLNDHLARHANLKNIPCPECPSRFNCRVDMVKHAEIHRKEKRHICDRCGSQFTRGYSLYQHKLLSHTIGKTYKCEQCPLTFGKPYTLKRHMRTHTGEKPYKCKYCDRAYAASGDLNKHLRIHVGTNTYMCDECPKAFKYQVELRDHKAEHYKMALKLAKELEEQKAKQESQENKKVDSQNDNKEEKQEDKKLEVMDLNLVQNTKQKTPQDEKNVEQQQ